MFISPCLCSAMLPCPSSWASPEKSDIWILHFQRAVTRQAAAVSNDFSSRDPAHDKGGSPRANLSGLRLPKPCAVGAAGAGHLARMEQMVEMGHRLDQRKAVGAFIDRAFEQGCETFGGGSGRCEMGAQA